MLGFVDPDICRTQFRFFLYALRMNFANVSFVCMHQCVPAMGEFMI